MRLRTLLACIVCVLLSIFLASGCLKAAEGDAGILVRRVIDGDTIELAGGERVRLIGIDTPEANYNSKLERDARRSKTDYETIIALGKRASQFTKNLAEGKRVRLEFDVEKRDKYDRLLAYVYLLDGRMLNAEIVKEGYGQVYTVPPNVKHADLFIKLQVEARENNRGFWNEKTLFR